MLASIPSPSESVIELGPLTLRAYGVMIAFGVVAAVLLSQRRWAARGGNPDDISTIALWAVPAGLLGARAYHVLTDWRFDEGWAQPFKIWEGGLGIPGGIAAGVLVGLWMIRRNGWAQPTLLDAIVPGLPLAQAIGRWGNYFNQELFGGPSDLPWAVEIDPDVAASAGHRDVETFTRPSSMNRCGISDSRCFWCGSIARASCAAVRCSRSTSSGIWLPDCGSRRFASIRQPRSVGCASISG